MELANRFTMHENTFPQPPDNPEFHYFTLKVESTSGNPHLLLRRMTQAAIREPKNPVNLYGKGLALWIWIPCKTALLMITHIIPAIKILCNRGMAARLLAI